MRKPVIGMTTDIVSRNPAVSHCPTLAETCRSAISTGSATLMIVSFRMTTNADTSSTVITVRDRGSSRSSGGPGERRGRRAPGCRVRGRPGCGRRCVRSRDTFWSGQAAGPATIGRGHRIQATEGDRQDPLVSGSPSAHRGRRHRSEVVPTRRRYRCTAAPVRSTSPVASRSSRQPRSTASSSVRSASSSCRAQLGEEPEPVADGPGGEAGPHAVALDECAGVGLQPERQQRAVLRRGEPGPDRLGRRRRSARRPGVPHALEDGQLVRSCAGQQRRDQAVLAAEQEQQHARAAADRGRERAQRQVGEAVVEHVAVGGVEQLTPPRRSAVRPVTPPIALACH